ncbi:hypothetical protein ACOSQ4_021461 [Xanthoceras sorbifolium]
MLTWLLSFLICPYYSSIVSIGLYLPASPFPMHSLPSRHPLVSAYEDADADWAVPLYRILALSLALPLLPPVSSELFPKDTPSLLLGFGLVSDPDLGYRPRRPVPCPMYQLTTIRLNQTNSVSISLACPRIRGTCVRNLHDLV